MKQKLMKVFLAAIFAALTTVSFHPASAHPRYTPCPGYNSLLSVGRQARVVPGNTVRIRDNPTTSGAELKSVSENSIVMVLAGSQCGDDYTWWKVRYRSTIGWMAEGQGDQHWLDTNLTTATTPSAPVSSASGTSAQYTQAGNPLCLAFNSSTTIIYGYSTLSSGSRVDTSITELKPLLICTNDTSDAMAFTPDGTAVTPEILDRIQDGSPYSVALPKWAYTVPGLWTLRAGGASLQINIQTVSNPYLSVDVAQAPVVDTGTTPTLVPLVMTAPLAGATQPPLISGQATVNEMSQYLTAVIPADQMNRINMDSPMIASLANNPTILNSIQAQDGIMNVINDNLMVVALPDHSDPTYVDSGQRESEVRLAGFAPDETVVLISGTVTRPDPFTFDLSNISGTRITVDEAGFFIGNVTTQGPILLALSQSRRVAVHGGFRFPDQETLVDQLYNAYLMETAPQPPGGSPSGNSHPLIYYESGSGNVVIGQLAPDGKYEDVAYPSPVSSGFTHVVGVGTRQVLFYNANTGVGQVYQIAADGNLIAQTSYSSFAVGWTHIVEGTGQVLFYRASDGLAALVTIDPNGTVNTLATYNITPGWTAVAGNNSWYILYNRADGSYETMQFYPDGNYSSTGISSSGGFSPGWTNIVGYNGKLVFYNAENGVVAFGTFADGRYVQVIGYSQGVFQTGWTHMVAADERLLFYNASVRNAETGIFNPDGSYRALEIISRLSGWTNIAASPTP